MTAEPIKEKGALGSGFRRRAAPFARQALRLTAHTATGVVGFAMSSLSVLRGPRSEGGEIAFPDVRLRPSTQHIESIFQSSVGSGARVIAVIGVEAGDGASTCARALAERSALAPSRTLLVDASGNGRPALPVADTEMENVGWFRLVEQEEPYRLRSPEFLRRLWEEAHRDWDTVVLDCSPALEDREYALPGKLVARSADAVVFVCLAGKATKHSVDAAMATVGSANVVGVIVNGRDQPSVGAELAREIQRGKRLFPKLSQRFAERALQSRILDVPA